MPTAPIQWSVYPPLGGVCSRTIHTPGIGLNRALADTELMTAPKGDLSGKTGQQLTTVLHRGDPLSYVSWSPQL